LVGVPGVTGRQTDRPVWAHSVNDAGDRHFLVDHLRGTAELAARFAEPFHGAEIAWWLGLLHDAGKASCLWQERLPRVEPAGGPVGLDHKSLGAQMARERRMALVALAVEGHHGGLTSPQELWSRLDGLSAADRDGNADAERALRELLPELATATVPTLPAAWRANRLVAEMAVRLLFSALCDADFLDTAAHFSGAQHPSVSADADFGVLRDRFETERTAYLSRRCGGAVDGIRAEVYDACVAAADLPPGVFRLAAPTGSGKTLASAGFALHHAAAHGHRRVVVAVPFLTITEQNAAVYRDLLESEGTTERVVLEHHSGVDFDQPGRRWARLAAENWDAPFVVTTMVRLFESLFGRKPAAMRRVHRLAGAVIVLDEVQALPTAMLVPILDALQVLVTHFGATVLLASATQPDFWHLSPFRGVPATDIIADPVRLVARVRRVRFEWWANPGPTVDELADQAAEGDRAMVVLNTTGDAAAVFHRWRDRVDAGVAWHLSTRMCPDHRRRVLDAVRGRLDRGEPTLLVSTQLIEAGVDVDFPVVYRALGPADSLLQAAGRANREGNLPGPGRVVVVDLVDGKMPPSYPPLVNQTRVHFGPGKAGDGTVDPDDLGALRDYYRGVYGQLNLEHPDHVGQRIQAARRAFDFRSVTDGPVDAVTGHRDLHGAFRMIRDNGIAVVTPQGAAEPATRKQIEKLVETVRTAPRPDIEDLRRLQPYTTTLHRSALRRPGVAAQLRAVLGDIDQPGALAEWIGGYDADTGIAVDPRTEEFVL
jgi:CRISPR-associated endonuclease/helicase Cas3